MSANQTQPVQSDDDPISGYVPNLPLAIIGVVVFGSLALTFFFNFFRNGRQRYMWPILMGTTGLTIGFVVRIATHFSPASMGVYIAMALFTLLSPCAFLAQNYVLLPRLAEHLGASDSLLLRPRIIGWVFVISDILTFAIQAGGQGLTTSDNPSTQHTGTTIAMIGIIAQLVSYCLFTLLIIVFWLKARSKPQVIAHGRGESWRTNWRVLFFQLGWSSIGYLVRNGYRTAEYAEGWNGKLNSTEWYFYVFDSIPLFLAILPWTILWAPRYLQFRESPIPLSSTNESSTSWGKTTA